MLTKKAKLHETEVIAPVEQCCTIIGTKLQPKLTDPGSFTIPCFIKDIFMDRVLCDLGASINFMPLSIVMYLWLKGMTASTMNLQLANKSLTYPEWEIKDVVVRVHKFSFPIDFIILNCEVDKVVSIVLGRPFLATSHTIIDVSKGGITMRISDKHITFSVLDNSSHKAIEKCHTIRVVKEILCGDISIKDDKKMWASEIGKQMQDLDILIVE
ncbi:uncharacterized protein LOC120125739 [Hibiscus syriacus]|uniref:uncharacterized protein LOC120125739 n=1 Tax=Hibiscus syriacus TaxID=106335 RepID=UPI0019226D19|nr:uncharacterized protein LOC120125739 [Hibiscus syriacus]